MVFTRYMLLSVSKRDNEDDRTLGEMFYMMISEVADITYHESMQIIVEAMLATVQEEFHIADVQLEAFHEKFMSKLLESRAAPIASGLRILSLEIYGFQGAVSIFYVGSLSK